MNFIQKKILQYKASEIGKSSFKEYLNEKKEILAMPIADLKFHTMNYITPRLCYQSYDIFLEEKDFSYKDNIAKKFKAMRVPKMGDFYKNYRNKSIPVSFRNFEKEAKPFTLYDFAQNYECKKSIYPRGYISSLPNKKALGIKNTWIIKSDTYEYQYKDSGGVAYDNMWTEPVTVSGKLTDLSQDYNSYHPNQEELVQLLEDKKCRTIRDLLVSQKWQKSLHILDVNAVINTVDNEGVDVYALQSFKTRSYETLFDEYQSKNIKASAPAQP